MNDPGDVLAMFPLGSVLLPHAALSLQVFEPRYRVMMFDLTRAARSGKPIEFGVVLIERGMEVGGGDIRFGVATVARVVEAVELPDGLWVLTAIGVRRVHVDQWLPEDPYPTAALSEINEPAWSGDDDVAFDQAASALREALALLARVQGGGVQGGGVQGGGVQGGGAEVARIDPSLDRLRAHWDLVAQAPLGTLDKQALLEAATPRDRLDQLGVLLDELSTTLAYQLGGEQS